MEEANSRLLIESMYIVPEHNANKVKPQKASRSVLELLLNSINLMKNHS